MRTHTARECVAPCPIHQPSNHHMADWTLTWRQDRGLFERTCPEHGIGHPDPDSLAWRNRTVEDPGVHGCCGCCRSPKETT